tara:strand:- start:1638 stop:2804 length:1167 start_codon:yes stop_codon:yes gene_type:complete
MNKTVKQFIGFVFFVGPIALFWFIPWYWVVLYYNLYWTYTSYILYEANKDEKELSLIYCLSLPLLFNFFGFLVVILTESKSKKGVEKSTIDKPSVVKKTEKSSYQKAIDLEIKKMKNSTYTIVYLFDKDGNEYRYSINESDIPEEINDEDDVEINIALQYHNLLNRPVIPDDPEVEGDEDNSYSFKSYTDGLELTDKELESEEAEMIPKELVEGFRSLNENERRVLRHEIQVRVSFTIKTNEGEFIEVFAQRHTLRDVIEEWNEGDKMWYSAADHDPSIDGFLLTKSEDGYRFTEDDLNRLFEIEGYYNMNWNGDSTDWCGIEEEDGYELSLKKWNDYKNKFPVISKKSQFDISGLEKKKTDINFCPNCGVKITEKINFCGDCGHKLN